MITDDLAPLITFGGRFGAGGRPDTTGEMGFHMGVVTSWDSRTGENTIQVAGAEVNNIPILSTADSIMLNPGDQVGLIRFRSTYFILGRIAPPGGGAAMGIRSAFHAPDVVLNTGTGDPTGVWLDRGGPTLTDVYIGSSQRCLVIMNTATACNNSIGFMGFTVSGASSIAATNPFSTALSVNNHADGGATVVGTNSATRVLTAADGLQQGFNTFEARYLFDTYNNGTGVRFELATITVFPF